MWGFINSFFMAENSQLRYLGKVHLGQLKEGMLWEQWSSENKQGGNQCGMSLKTTPVEFFTLYTIDINAISPSPFTVIKVTLTYSLACLAPPPWGGDLEETMVSNQCLILKNFKHKEELKGEYNEHPHVWCICVQPLVSILPHFTFPSLPALFMCVCLHKHTRTHFPLYHLKVKGHHTMKLKALDTSPYIFFFKDFLLHNCNAVITHKFDINSGNTI